MVCTVVAMSSICTYNTTCNDNPVPHGLQHLWYFHCSLLLEPKRVFEVEKDINSHTFHSIIWIFDALDYETCMSSSSRQCIKGSKCKEIGRHSYLPMLGSRNDVIGGSSMYSL